METALTLMWLYEVSRASLLAAGISLVSQLHSGRETFPIQMKGEVAEGKLCVSLLSESLYSFPEKLLLLLPVLWYVAREVFLSCQTQQPALPVGLVQWSVCHFRKPCLSHVGHTGRKGLAQQEQGEET